MTALNEFSALSSVSYLKSQCLKISVIDQKEAMIFTEDSTPKGVISFTTK